MPSFPQEPLFAAGTTPGTRSRATLGARVSLALLLALLSMTASSFAETAYSALRAVANQRGEEILQRVIEVRGDGKWEPETWKVVVSDPRAKAGIREIAVRKGRITSDSTPKKTLPAGTPMDLTLLNLDSEGVLAVINGQTEATPSAERISYTLSNGPERGTPVWTVKLQPPRSGLVTSLVIDADTGAVLAKTQPPAASAAPLLSNREPAGEIDPSHGADADTRDGRTASKNPGRDKPSTRHSRESADEVSDLVDSLIKRAGKPGRILRRFLP